MKRHLILPALLLATCALSASGQEAPRPAAIEPAQESFTGKFVCVEDADNSWPLAHVHLVKVGYKTFIAGEMVPPPPESVAIKDADDAKKPAAKPVIKHRQVMIPVDKVVDLQIFDTEEDLNTYYDSLDDGDKADDKLDLGKLKVH